jgi:hypothetical protein
VHITLIMMLVDHIKQVPMGVLPAGNAAKLSSEECPAHP